MNKSIEIKLDKCTLLIYENELMRMLAAFPDIFQKASGRGKAAQRVNSTLRRQAQGFTSTELFHELNANIPDRNASAWVEGMDAEEVKEAVKSYFESMAKARI